MNNTAILKRMASGTFSNAKTESLTMEVLQKYMERLTPLPKFNVVIGHPEKVKNWQRELCEHGLTVRKNEFIVDKIQIFKPRTKKKRIQKKAIKRFGFREVPSNNVYLIDTQTYIKCLITGLIDL